MLKAGASARSDAINVAIPSLSIHFGTIMSNTHQLSDRRILLVEDEFLVGFDLCYELELRGATVIGPLATLDDAMHSLEQVGSIDVAVLDILLRGDEVYPLADILTQREVPYIFASGYSAAALPIRFQRVPRCEKPATMGELVDLVEKQL